MYTYNCIIALFKLLNGIEKKHKEKIVTIKYVYNKFVNVIDSYVIILIFENGKKLWRDRFGKF